MTAKMTIEQLYALHIKAMPAVTTVPSPTEVASTATSQPEFTVTPSIALPGGARFKTPEQAAAYAIEIVELKFKAQNPKIVSVELLTLEDAM